MQEQLIKFETAKKLKEKGFDWKSTHYYVLDVKPFKSTGIAQQHLTPIENNTNIVQYVKVGKNQAHIASAPTQSLAQKWLREVYDIHIEVGRNKFMNLGKSYYCYFIYDAGQEEHNNTGIAKVLDLAYRKSNNISLEEKDLLFDTLMIEHGIAFKTYEEALEAAIKEATEIIYPKKTS